MVEDKPKNVLVRVGEDFGLIIGGLIFLFAVLFGAAWLLTEPLHLSPNGPNSARILLLIFFFSFAPFQIMYWRRAKTHPLEALRVYKYFLIYGIWCGISGIAGVLALDVFAWSNGIFSWEMLAWLIFFVIMTPFAIHKFEKVQKQMKILSAQKNL